MAATHAPTPIVDFPEFGPKAKRWLMASKTTPRIGG
jgi:hypothetical protein